MQNNPDGMWLSEKESELINLFRSQSEQKQAEILSAVNDIYDEKIEAVRREGRNPQTDKPSEML